MIPANHKSAIKEASELIAARTISGLELLLGQEAPIKTEDGHAIDLSLFREKADDMIKGQHLSGLAQAIALVFERSYDDLDQEMPRLRSQLLMGRAGDVVFLRVMDACAAASGRPRPTLNPSGLGHDIRTAMVHAAGRTTYAENVTVLSRKVKRHVLRECDRDVGRILVPLEEEIPDRSPDPRNTEDHRGIPYSACF